MRGVKNHVAQTKFIDPYNSLYFLSKITTELGLYGFK